MVFCERPATDFTVQVEIQIDLDELEEGGENLESVFDLEEDPFTAEVVDAPPAVEDLEDHDPEEEHFSDISSEDELDLDEEPVFEEALRDTLHVKEMASKLDSVLKLVFDHLHTTHSSDPPLPPPLSSLNPPHNSIPSLTDTTRC